MSDFDEDIDDLETEGKKRAKTIEELELESIMKVPNGRNVLYRLLVSTGYFADPFSADPYIHANRAGSRKVGIHLVNLMMEANPRLYQTMIAEKNNG